MDRRKGKTVKGSRTRRSANTDVGSLLEKACRIKRTEGLATGTMYRYEYVTRLFCDYLKERGHSLMLSDLDEDTCREFTTWLLEDRIMNDGHKYKPDSSKTKGVSPRYANDLIKSLRTLFRLLIEETDLEANPFERVKTVRAPQKIINVLTPDELRALLAAPDKRKYAEFRDYVLINVLIDSMARIGELVSLRECDVNFKSKELLIRGEITKTRAGRIIPVQGRTIKLLKELQEEVKEFESEYLFLSNYGDMLEPNNFRHRLRTYAKKAGITKRVKPHLIRHSAATIYLESGGNLRYLQSLLGHVDQRMTSRYTHLSRSSIAENHDNHSALNSVISKLNKPRKIIR